jgi:hypothetical protein
MAKALETQGPVGMEPIGIEPTTDLCALFALGQVNG